MTFKPLNKAPFYKYTMLLYTYAYVCTHTHKHTHQQWQQPRQHHNMDQGHQEVQEGLVVLGGLGSPRRSKNIHH